MDFFNVTILKTTTTYVKIIIRYSKSERDNYEKYGEIFK